MNAKEVIRFEIEGLSQKIASTKRIGGYEIWQEDLPRTTTRKLKRFEIEKRVRANQGKRRDADAELPASKPLTSEDEAWLTRPDVQRAVSVIRESASKAPEQIRPDDNLELDLGLDSMQRVELLVALEQHLGGDVEESQLAEIYTVRQIIDAVLESAGSGKVRLTTREQFAGWKTVLEEEPADPEVRSVATPSYLSSIPFYFLFHVLFRSSLVIGFISRSRDLKTFRQRVRTSFRQITRLSRPSRPGVRPTRRNFSSALCGWYKRYFRIRLYAQSGALHSRLGRRS